MPPPALASGDGEREVTRTIEHLTEPGHLRRVSQEDAIGYSSKGREL